jgi:hypothetical protein
MAKITRPAEAVYLIVLYLIIIGLTTAFVTFIAATVWKWAIGG